MGGIVCIYSLDERNLGAELISILKELKHLGDQGAGIAILRKSGEVFLKKHPGGIENLEASLKFEELVGNIGIGSTRYATHGRPHIDNTQPMTDCSRTIYLVMDGVIGEYDTWKERLSKKGHIFLSRNDTELLAHFLEEALQGRDIYTACSEILRKFEGFFASVFFIKDNPKIIGIITKRSKLFIGVKSDNEYVIASELEPLVQGTKKYYVMNGEEFAIISDGEIQFYDKSGERITKKPLNTPSKIEYPVPGGFPHFMLREIFEIPKAIYRALFTHQKTYIDLIARMLMNADKIYMIGCGSSFYAAQVGSYILRELADVPSEVIDATEFPFYALKNIKPGTVIVALSQSGATTDVIRAVMKAKMFGASIIGIINVLGSPLMFASNLYLPIGVGPEHAVPATKSFIGQLLALYRIALRLIEMKETLPSREIESLRKAIFELPDVLEKTIQNVVNVAKSIAQKIVKTHSVLVASRGINYPIALEGALKLKEVAYIHAEGIEAGELRHGGRAILDKGFPVILVTPAEEDARIDAYQLLSEITPTGAHLVIITNEDDASTAQKLTKDILTVPKVPGLLTPFVNVIPLQLIAYWVGVLRGNPIDKPRGLRKYVVLH